jgi:hypothetical protein
VLYHYDFDFCFFLFCFFICVVIFWFCFSFVFGVTVDPDLGRGLVTEAPRTEAGVQGRIPEVVVPVPDPGPFPDPDPDRPITHPRPEDTGPATKKWGGIFMVLPPLSLHFFNAFLHPALVLKLRTNQHCRLILVFARV